jgi:rod shape-determining protein MreC
MKKVRFALAIAVLAAIFHFIPFFDTAEAWVTRTVLGVGASLRGAGLSVNGFMGNIGRIAGLKEENGRLKARVAELEAEHSAVTDLRSENESLKGLIAYSDRTGYKLIPARVTGTDPDATVRALVIDRGSEEGIVRGDPVIAGNGIYIGKIERVVPGRSTVLLPIDPRSSIAVMSAERPETDGVALGEKGLVISMGFIPQRAPLKEGDVIITTGRESRIPRGLMVGKVESVDAVPSDPFMSATVIPTIDPIVLTKVAVIHLP